MKMGSYSNVSACSAHQPRSGDILLATSVSWWEFGLKAIESRSDGRSAVPPALCGRGYSTTSLSPLRGWKTQIAVEQQPLHDAASPDAG
jgi:hypothetical protein